MKIHVTAKCDDRSQVRVPELDLDKIGYVPRGLGLGGGDYVRFTIDSKTGKVEGWKPLSTEDLKDCLES